MEHKISQSTEDRLWHNYEVIKNTIKNLNWNLDLKSILLSTLTATAKSQEFRHSILFIVAENCRLPSTLPSTENTFSN